MRERLTSWLQRYIAERWAFVAVILAFALFATYYALHNGLGATPDEAFHYGMVKTYAEQYSPWVTQQDSVAVTNDMIRQSSYFYHYLMSFPYRLLDAWGLSDRTVLVTLRLTSVAMGIVTLVLLRRLLQAISTPGIAFVATTLFALLPITLITFGGLNYDNLFLPVTFGCLLLLLSMRRRPRVVTLVVILTLLQLGAITKFTFLPLAVVLFIYLAVLTWRHRQELVRQLRAQPVTPRAVRATVAVAFVLATGLFIERYGVNLVTYHSVNPPCGASHSQRACLEFPINLRHYNATAVRDQVEPKYGIVGYTAHEWYKNMVRGLLYPSSLLFLRYVIFAFVVLAVIAIAIRRSLGYRDREVGLVVMAMSLFYVAAVFIDEYRIYVLFAQPYAINGRYLLPAIPFLLVAALANISQVQRMFAGSVKMLGR